MLEPGQTVSVSAPSRRASILSLASDYLSLTKPPIVLLLLITALGGVFVASEGSPPLMATLLLMLGGATAAGGASAINHYLDRDIDGLMVRTRQRALPSRRIAPRAALIFGVVLNVFAFGLLAAWVNLLTAALTLSGTLFYVFVYTYWLKRTTTQNIVIGGAAGAVPPLAGWAAVTGGLELPALYLFAIVFFWTPPHFWALALLMRRDYARAGIPMLPVVAGLEATRRNIILYTVVVVTVTILFLTTQAVGLVYIASAILLGVGFLLLAWQLETSDEARDGRPQVRGAKALYLYSLAYVALLFAAVMVDSVVRI